MSKKYSIEIDNGIVVIRFSAKPVIENIFEAFDEINQIAENQLRCWVFANGLDFSGDELELIANRAASAELTPGKVAIVAPEDLSFGVSRMYEVLREDYNIQQQVFRSEAEARDWLLEEPAD